MATLKDKLKEVSLKLRKATAIDTEAAKRMLKVQAASSQTGKEVRAEKA